ncbi:LamG domain-containing protein [Streptomyces mirabilis]|uniref:LamG-like jellyroll fold domain-containing protein n=1 Tax=Streptomyces mirabilis TaxID=68239 RepID=UPI002E23C50F
MRKGRTLTVKGTLTRADWETSKYSGYTGQPVALRFKAEGATAYKTVKTVTSGSKGALTTTVKAATDGSYRYKFAGTSTSATATGDYDPVSLGSVTDTATHSWNLDDGTGTTAADPTGTLLATLTGGAAWSTDADRGTVLSLNGTASYATTNTPGVDTSGTSFTAVYGAKAVAGKWTHLVGVFDADAGRLLLYVNGRLSATKAFTGTDWNAVGPVQFGRRLYQGAYGEYADGRLSDVRLYPTALPPADAAAPGGNATLTQLD